MPRAQDGAIDLYLDLLKGALTRDIFDETYHSVAPRRGTAGSYLYAPFNWLLGRGRYELVMRTPLDARKEGRDIPHDAETMVGRLRLDQLQRCITDVLDQEVPGDLLEAGGWRGGAAIFMRAVLKAHGVSDRRVFVADSFQGLPRPEPNRFPHDAEDVLWSRPQLAVSIETVKANFQRYGLLDDRVCFLPGFFDVSLRSADIGALAILRVDADMYQSTTEVLDRLYPKVSAGGCVIIDDYGAMTSCRAAVDDFRKREGVVEELCWIDWTGVFWRKQTASPRSG